MDTTVRPMFLGIKLSKEENRALLTVAENDGLQKSAYARRILRAHLISLGAITVTNPAPQADEVTQGIR
ncbi:MAG: hypothetical protein QY332_14685 [Anaerolineales bacterium]|nr:MAG: hypothetical protein QY332_14685 [Anaerolineales bacterium]